MAQTPETFPPENLLAACADPPAAPVPAAHAQIREPVSASGSFLAARHAERERDWDGASRYLEQALAAEPTNFDLLLRAHAAVVADGKFDAGVALARRIVEVSSANPQANLTLAIEDIRLGRPADASRRLEELPVQGVNRAALPLLKAWIDLGRGQSSSAAVERLKPLGEIAGFKPLQEMHAGLIEDLGGRTAEAEASFKAALAAEGGPPPRIVEAASPRPSPPEGGEGEKAAQDA